MNKSYMRDYDEGAIVVSPKVPVAVRDFQTLLDLKIGTIEEIRFGNAGIAYKFKTIEDEEFGKFFGTDDHIWIDPSAENYSLAWEKSGAQSPKGQYHLDHLHNKARAIKEGHGLVLLYPCPGGPNTSAGHNEKQVTLNTTKNLAQKEPVFYAEKIHFCKMWGVYQNPRGMTQAEIDREFDKYQNQVQGTKFEREQTETSERDPDTRDKDDKEREQPNQSEREESRYDPSHQPEQQTVDQYHDNPRDPTEQAKTGQPERSEHKSTEQTFQPELRDDRQNNPQPAVEDHQELDPVASAPESSVEQDNVEQTAPVSSSKHSDPDTRAKEQDDHPTQGSSERQHEQEQLEPSQDENELEPAPNELEDERKDSDFSPLEPQQESEEQEKGPENETPEQEKDNEFKEKSTSELDGLDEPGQDDFGMDKEPIMEQEYDTPNNHEPNPEERTEQEMATSGHPNEKEKQEESLGNEAAEKQADQPEQEQDIQLEGDKDEFQPESHNRSSDEAEHKIEEDFTPEPEYDPPDNDGPTPEERAEQEVASKEQASEQGMER